MEKDFNKESKLFIKRLMLENELSFVELNKKLSENGFDYSDAAVRQKITRGRFDFAFVLQICEVLDIKLTTEAKKVI